MSKVSGLFSSALSGADNDNVVRLSEIRKEPRTLVLGNTIYQISNIAAIQFLDLSTVKRFPSWYWFILLAAIYSLFLVRNMQIIGIVLLGVFLYLWYRYEQNKVRENYGLRIVSNSGESTTLVGPARERLREVGFLLAGMIDRQDTGTTVIALNDQSKTYNTRVGTNEGVVQIGDNNQAEQYPKE